MTCTATGCATPTADGITLCETHQTSLWALLGQIPDTLTDAEDTVARLDARRNTGRGTTATTPVNLEASQRVDELDGLLASWSRMVYEETGQAGDAGADYLRHAWTHIIGQDWAGDMLDELDRAHRRVVACVDVPPSWSYLGKCGVQDCTGLIRGSWTLDTSRTPPVRVVAERAICTTCHTPYSGKEVYAWQVARMAEKRLGMRKIAEILAPINGAPSRRTLGRWVQQGLINDYGEPGAPMLDPGEVVAEMKRRERQEADLTA